MMETKREMEHLLVLKVMRLTRPTLTITHPITCDPRDLPHDTFHNALQKDLATVRGLEYFALGELLTLPQNFGNIFLGETFSCYISVHNDSIHTCRDILIKADLQTSSQRLTLSGASGETTGQMGEDESVDDVIHHEVKELGTHILVCSVSYSTHTGEKMYFRKFFKFQVLKPLDVKTKFYNAESDEVYLEAQIQNITPNPLFMERVCLDPSAQYMLREVHSDKHSNEESVFGNANYMSPLDVRQYLYCLTPKPDMYADAKVLKGVTNVGKLDIVWKTNMGENGRLQTSALQRVAPGYGDIRLTVESIPEAVAIEKVFHINIRVTNCSERTMDLVLTLQNSISASVSWCGTSGKQLGKIQPASAIYLDLAMIPLAAGLHTISGLRILDKFLKRTYEHDDITQIYVYNEFD